MEPRHLTSSVTRSQMLLQDPSLQTPHQRKMFLLVYPWRPTLHTRATKLTRCSSLQQRPLQETSSYRRPAWNLPTWATFLVKHMMLSFNIQINKVCVEGGWGGGLRHLSFFLLFQVFSSHLRLLDCSCWLPWPWSSLQVLTWRRNANSQQVCFQVNNRETTQSITYKATLLIPLGKFVLSIWPILHNGSSGLLRCSAYTWKYATNFIQCYTKGLT